MNNATETRKELATLFAEVKAGTVDRQVAAQLVNIANAQISSAVAQVRYAEARKESPKIAFLEEPKVA